MFKVLAVVDKEGTALDRLAKGVSPYNNNLNYSVIAVHPKRPDQLTLDEFEREARYADIIHYYYWKTAEMLREKFPWLKDKVSVLSHYNPYSIYESDWKGYDLVIAPNKTIQTDLEKMGIEAPLVPITIDTDFWTFNPDWQPNKTVLMVANRIEGKKGILPVAIACGELGLKFQLVGAVSDRNYLESIHQTGALEFHEQVSDARLKELYYNATVVVCNSVDGFESGTMPVLEAMLCGTPVLSRKVGHVPDLYNGSNMTIIDSHNEDVQEIMRLLTNMLNDKKGLEEQRQVAWNTAKNYSDERRAYSLQRLYRTLGAQPSVSVVVPIYDKPDTIRACLNAIAMQDYSNIELIVCDDATSLQNHALVGEFSQTVNFPVRYIPTASDTDYGLARARNKGIIEATGDLIVFCDQRMVMEPTAVREFALNITPKTWLYGSKGVKKDFVENFSCIHRSEIVSMGMFNERITGYGGMSQEIRSRAKSQGYRLEYLESAKAVPMGKSRNRHIKRDEIIKMKNLLFKVGF